MTDTLGAVYALLVAFAFLVPPGYAVLSMAWPSGDLLGRLAIAPAITVGATMLWATILEKFVHAPVAYWSVLPVVWLFPVVLAVVSRRRRSAHSDAAQPLPSVRRPDWVDLSFLGAAMVFAIWMWLTVSSSLTRIPGNDDGTHHAVWSWLIYQRQTIDPRQITVGDILTDTPNWAFYPFGVHVQAAFMHAVAAVPIAVAAVAIPVLLSSVFLPLGMFAVLRALTPAGSRLPAVAAGLVVLYPRFPWSVPEWGGFALIAAYALVPSVVAAVVLIPGDPRVRRVLGGVAVGLAGLGIFYVQSSAAAAVAVIAVVVVPASWWAGRRVRGGPGVPAMMATLGVAALVAGVSLAPWRSALAEGTTERGAVYDAGSPSREAWVSLQELVIGSKWEVPGWYSWLMAITFIGGVLVLLVRRTAWSWFVGAGLLVGIFVWIAFGWPGAREWTFAWYSQRFRVGLHMGILVMPVVALFLVTVVDVLRAIARRLPTFDSATVTARAGIGLVAFATVWSMAPVIQGPSTARVEGAWAQTPQGDRAYQWMADHIAPGERVLNDFSQGSAWMYLRAGLNPIFASKPEIWPNPNPFGDRMQLLFRSGDVGVDPALTRIADEWNVRFAYVGADSFFYHLIFLTPLVLDNSPGWRRVYTDGLAVVYERVR